MLGHWGVCAWLKGKYTIFSEIKEGGGGGGGRRPAERNHKAKEQS